MRNEKELFELMLKHQDLFEYGMCLWFIKLRYSDIINITERRLLENYLKNDKLDSAGGYWWTKHELQPRIDWINEQIEKL